MFGNLSFCCYHIRDWCRDCYWCCGEEENVRINGVEVGEDMNAVYVGVGGRDAAYTVASTVCKKF